MIPHLVCAVAPYLFYTYFFHGALVIFIPMFSRFGEGVNPDLLIAVFTIGIALTCGGFLVPMLNMFRKSKTIICTLLGVTLLFIILAATPMGFPFRAETNVQHFSFLVSCSRALVFVRFYVIYSIPAARQARLPRCQQQCETRGNRILHHATGQTHLFREA